MKVRAGIIAVVLSVSVSGIAWTDVDADGLVVTTVDGRRKKLTFGKYYEAYELNIEPNAPGYMLPLDLNHIVNFADLRSLIDPNSISSLIRQNGFAIVELTSGVSSRYLRDDFVNVYGALGPREIPLFITADTVLYLYHTLLDETLKDIEERQLSPDVNDLTIALLNDALQQHGQLDGDLKEAAKRNIAYLCVARRLIDPNAFVPELAYDLVLSELAKIEAHRGFKPSDILMYEEDYSQYVPRGHYTRSEALKRYFRAMMWYGRMPSYSKAGLGD